MKNKYFKRNMFGNLPTQEMAQKALKILTTYAQRPDTLLIKKLAKEVTPGLP